MALELIEIKIIINVNASYLVQQWNMEKHAQYFNTKGKDLLTAVVIPKGYCSLFIGEMRSFETELVFESSMPSFFGKERG